MEYYLSDTDLITLLEEHSDIAEFYTENELKELQNIKTGEELTQTIKDMDRHILKDCVMETGMCEGDVITAIKGEKIEGRADIQIHRFNIQEDITVGLGDVYFNMDKDGKNVSIQSLNIEESDIDLFDFTESDITEDIQKNLFTNFDIAKEIQDFENKDDVRDIKESLEELSAALNEIDFNRESSLDEVVASADEKSANQEIIEDTISKDAQER